MLPDLRTEKGISLVIFFLVTLLPAVAVVLLFSRCQRRLTSRTGRHVLSLLQCFAGGVFLSTCLMGLLAEGFEEYLEFQEVSGFSGVYPFFHLGIGVGFFLVAYMERVAFCLSRGHGHGHEHGHHGHGDEDTASPECGGDRGVVGTSGSKGQGVEEQRKDIGQGTEGERKDIGQGTEGERKDIGQGTEGERKDIGQGTEGERKDTGQGTEGERKEIEQGTEQYRKETEQRREQQSEKTEREQRKETRQNGNTASQTDAGSSVKDTTRHRRAGTPNVSAVHTAVNSAEGEEEREGKRKGKGDDREETVAASEMSEGEEGKGKGDGDAGEEAAAPETRSGVRAVMFLLALSFHTLFDGLAVGLQDSRADVWAMTAAISVHKVLMVISLALELAATFPATPRRTLLLLLLFALMTPVGVAIGMGVTSGQVNLRAQLLAGSVLQAVACGSVLYVTFFEMLSEELGHDTTVAKVTTTLIGFSAIAVAKIWDSD
ncbi:uncharacterized protein LOC143302320 [Babylonia areolata]|uniref:uncharacterized protein LOC143302320 n=1 Tax=Babylonia areolata TaxID=304850 RepID=UPI003FD694E9